LSIAGKKQKEKGEKSGARRRDAGRISLFTPGGLSGLGKEMPAIEKRKKTDPKKQSKNHESRCFPKNEAGRGKRGADVSSALRGGKNKQKRGENRRELQIKGEQRAILLEAIAVKKRAQERKNATGAHSAGGKEFPNASCLSNCCLGITQVWGFLLSLLKVRNRGPERWRKEEARHIRRPGRCWGNRW